MKLNKSYIIGVGVLAGLALTSCQNNFDEPQMVIPEATMKPNMTIAELKDATWQDDTNYAIKCPKTEDGQDIIIHGRVISSDAAGNVYKSLYIQDETGAITLSVNQSDMWAMYNVGQEIVINVTDLYIGKYAGLQQIGGLGEYNGTPQVTFMTWLNMTKHTELNGLPQTEEPTLINYGADAPKDHTYVISCDIPTLNSITTSADDLKKMQSQLVEIKNVHFEDAGKLSYATEDESVSRNIIDENNNVIIVRTSGYSTFWNEILPEGVGTIRGLLGYYNGTWQITLRSLNDVIGFDSKGTASDPYTVEEAIGLENTGAIGWVKGYIVGSVKGNVSGDIKDNNDINWSKDADFDDTLVIGQTADTKDLANCLVMALPQGSDLRKTVNLLDNPDRYGQEIKVRGQFAQYLGTNGIVGNDGSSTQFWVEGMTDPGEVNEPSGEGTKESPYNVAAIIAKCEETGETATTDTYYFGGYVTSITEISASYGNATFYIADTPGGTPTFYVYRVKGFDNQKVTNESFIKVGDYVVVCSAVVNFKGNTPETVQNTGYVVSVNGATSDSEIDPGEVTPPAEGQGSGTEDDPFTVGYVQSCTADVADVWVEGYVVGFISGKAYDAGANFSNTVEGADYTNTNLILGPAATSNTTASCIPVQLPSSPSDIRTTLGLGNNPDIYLKKVKLKGKITKYFSVMALKEVSAYKIVE